MLVGILTADGLAARVAVTVAVRRGRENGYPPVTRVCAWCENPIPALGIRCLCALDVPYVFMARFSIRAGSPGYTGQTSCTQSSAPLRRAGWRASIGRSQFLQIRPGAWLKASGTVSLRLSVKSAP
jgi:hypothetical protein